MGYAAKIALGALIAYGGTVYADEDISIKLESVRLYDLVKIAYAEQGAGFVVDSDLINDDQAYSLDIRNMTPNRMRSVVDALLAERQYSIQDKGQFYSIRKTRAKDVDRVPFFYRPRHRSVTYLTDMVNGVFSKGRFTFQANARQANPSPDTASTTDTLDSGTSAYSMMQKPLDGFLFLGSKDEIDLLNKLLVELDTPPNEILVKAYLYEVSNTKSEGSAFNAALSIITGKLGINIESPTYNNSINISLPNIEAVFSAFSTDNRFRVISSPSLRVKDGATANFTVGAEVPILGSVTTQNSGAATQSVEYKSSGTILDISPIIRQTSIELDIRQQVSNFIKTTNGVNNSPTLIKRELSSTINTRDGDLILIGGLDESTMTDESTGLSWLPKFLKTNTSDNIKTDILLVLHVTRI